MRTMFLAGMESQSHYWMSAVPVRRLGQSDPGTLTDDQRKTLLSEIDKTLNTHEEVADLAGRPDFKTILGQDFAAFQAARAQADPLQPAMEELWNRFTYGSAEDSYWLEKERANYVVWRKAVAQMALLSAAAETQAKIPGAAPTPPKKTTAPAQPSGPVTPPEPMILGIPQDQFLIGASALVGAGILVAVLA